MSRRVETLAKLAFDTYGGVHLLFNNAGVGADTTVWESSLADWQWVLGVNLWGVIHGVHYFVPRMLEQDTEGHIVNTASIGGLQELGLVRSDIPGELLFNWIAALDGTSDMWLLER